MKPSRQATAVTEKLLKRRAAISRSRTSNDADAVELGAEKRSDALAENQEISDVLIRLSERETVELREVDAALERLSNGTWGRCEQCHGPIDARRMAVLPEARTCSNCID
jgi:RNA polymerase-binding transcription factor DksA